MSTSLKPSPRSIPVRALEKYEVGMIATFAVMMAVFGDESGIDAIASGLVSAVLFAVFFGLLQLVVESVRWWNYELTVEEESLVVRSGLLRPKRRTIPFSRIQRSTVSTTTVSRPFGLAALECDTAGNPDEADVSVRYLERETAEALRQRIGSAAGTDSTPLEPPDPDRRRVFTLGLRNLALYGVARLHPKTVLLAALTWVGVRYFEPDAMTGLRSTAVALLEDFLPLSPAVTLGVVVLGGWLVGVVLAVERMARFRLSAGEGSFRRRHGLHRTTDADVSSDRIQLARVRSNPLHRALGLAQADVGTAGLSDVTPFGLQWPLAPLARRDVAWGLVERAVGVDRSTVELRSLPTRARRRYAVRYALAVVALAVGTVIAREFVAVARAIPLPMFVVGLALAPLAGHVTWSHRGYALLDDHVVVRRGFWTRRTYVVPADHVQNLTVSQSPFQRRADLASVRLDVASMPFLPGVLLPDVDESVAAELQRRLLEDETGEDPIAVTGERER